MREPNLQKSEAYLPWLVIACSITGLVIGRLNEGFGPSLEWWIPYGLFLMIPRSRREYCYRTLALLQEKTGRMDEAVDYYKRAIKESRSRTGGTAA